MSLIRFSIRTSRIQHRARDKGHALCGASSLHGEEAYRSRACPVPLGQSLPNARRNVTFSMAIMVFHQFALMANSLP